MMSANGDVSSWKVLLVEDDPDNLDVARQVLTFYGAQVYSAANGLEGLKLLDEVVPTFILLDLSMPNMDGWEMLRRVRANPRMAGVLVIALTAHAMNGDRERALKAGFDGYIIKPFMLSTFMGDIKRCLSEMAQ